jgi:hypothetical protein
MIEEQMIAQQMKQKIVGDIKLTPSEVRNFIMNCHKKFFLLFQLKQKYN